MSMDVCPCNRCAVASKRGSEGAYEAGKLAGAAEEREAILSLLRDEADRLDRVEDTLCRVAARTVRYAVDVVTLWRVGHPEATPRSFLRAWLA